MLPIVVKGRELFDERTETFIETKDTTLHLEHSLMSLAKWESKWHKPFLDEKTEKTNEEMKDYIRCMTITQNVDPMVYESLTQKNIKEIRDYIDDPMTATWFNDKKTTQGRKKPVTAELIYYWMITLEIPFECEKWHLNRLLTLIRVCNIEGSPKTKMSKTDIMKQNAMLNAQRKKARGH